MIIESSNNCDIVDIPRSFRQGLPFDGGQFDIIEVIAEVAAVHLCSSINHFAAWETLQRGKRIKCGGAIGCSGCVWLQVSRSSHFPQPLQQLLNFFWGSHLVVTTWEPCTFPPQVKSGASAGKVFVVVENVLKMFWRLMLHLGFGCRSVCVWAGRAWWLTYLL